MLHVTGERTLEKYKAFPYIAWTLVIGFAIFVYNLTMNLSEVAENLAISSSNLEKATTGLIEMQKEKIEEE